MRIPGRATPKGVARPFFVDGRTWADPFPSGILIFLPSTSGRGSQTSTASFRSKAAA